MPEFTGNELVGATAAVGGLLAIGIVVTVGRTLFRMVKKGAGEASV